MKAEDKKNPLLPVVFIMGAIIIGLVINMISGSMNKEDFGGAGWSSSDTEVMTTSSEEEDVTDSRTDNQDAQTTASLTNTDPSDLQDGFLLIESGTFLMGSPESENWRIDDEVQHEVSVSSFYIDPWQISDEEE